MFQKHLMVPTIIYVYLSVNTDLKILQYSIYIFNTVNMIRCFFGFKIYKYTIPGRVLILNICSTKYRQKFGKQNYFLYQF